MKKLRMVVIGAGHLGRIHARLLKSNDTVELIGVVDPIVAARERATSELGVASYAHHYEVLGKIDAAIVATPTVLHHEVALEFLRSGVHCFVEKPICPTVAEADELISAAKAQRLVLQVGHVEQFNPALAAVQLPSDPSYIEARRSSGYSFRSTDIGVVLDLMIHDIDLALSLAESDVVDVQATGRAVFGPHEDLAEARLTFAGGCVANLWASRVSPHTERTLTVFADDTQVRFDLATRTSQIVRPGAQVLRGEFDPRALSPAEQAHFKERLFSELLLLETDQAEERNAIADEHADFVAGITLGRQVRVSGEAGRDALAVAERILACVSASQQRDERRDTLPLSSRVRPSLSRSASLHLADSKRRAG